MRQLWTRSNEPKKTSLTIEKGHRKGKGREEENPSGRDRNRGNLHPQKNKTKSRRIVLIRYRCILLTCNGCSTNDNITARCTDGLGSSSSVILNISMSQSSVATRNESDTNLCNGYTDNFLGNAPVTVALSGFAAMRSRNTQLQH